MGSAGAPVRRMPMLGSASPPDALENREPRLNRGPHQCHPAAETAVLRGSVEKLQVHGDGCEKTSQLVFKPTDAAVTGRLIDPSRSRFVGECTYLYHESVWGPVRAHRRCGA